MKFNVLLLETVHETAMRALLGNENVNLYTSFDKIPKSQHLPLSNMHVIITRGKGQVKKDLIEQCPHLKIIGRCGVGLDNIDVDMATKYKIKVVNAPNSNADTIAEHTLSLILMLQRNMYQAITETKTNNWNWRNEYQGDEIKGKKLGIVGLGNIGTKVARLALAFGLEVSYWDHKQNYQDFNFIALNTLLKESNIISIHLPLTKETTDLFNEEKFKLLRPGALLINTARGQIVNENALINALDHDQLRGYAADVLAIEPPYNTNLTSHPKTLITAHLGSLTATTYEKICFETIKNITALLNGEATTAGCVFNLKNIASNVSNQKT